jgi:hypothetical protein
MAFSTIKIKNKKFISSYSYDYTFQILESDHKSLIWLKNLFDSIAARFEYINGINGEYIKLYNPAAISLTRGL